MFFLMILSVQNVSTVVGDQDVHGRTRLLLLQKLIEGNRFLNPRKKVKT